MDHKIGEDLNVFGADCGALSARHMSCLVLSTIVELPLSDEDAVIVTLSHVALSSYGQLL